MLAGYKVAESIFQMTKIIVVININHHHHLSTTTRLRAGLGGSRQ